MVTKHSSKVCFSSSSFILAKNHMVTKHNIGAVDHHFRFILAKNHMVTKPQIHVTIYLKIIKY